jgi:probable F420-dependent oxidoreductase
MQFGFRCSEGGDRYADALQEVVHAEELGFDSAWLAEHHGWDMVWPSPHVALAGFATRTETIRLGTSISLLSQTNPVTLAGEANLLDVISGGRFTLGVGVGWRRREMENLGYDFEARGPRMTEHMEAMKALWASDVASYDGRFVSFEDFEVSPKAVQSPHPPVWVGGAADVSLKRAAYLGDAWYPIWFDSIDELEAPYERYDEYVREAGGDPADRERPILRVVGIDEDPNAAREYLAELFADLVDGYVAQGMAVPPALQRFRETDFETFADGRLIYGDPEECIADIQALRDRLGIDHVVFKLYFPGVSHERVMAGLDLLAEEVLSHV